MASFFNFNFFLFSIFYFKHFTKLKIHLSTHLGKRIACAPEKLIKFNFFISFLTILFTPNSDQAIQTQIRIQVTDQLLLIGVLYSFLLLYESRVNKRILCAWFIENQYVSTFDAIKGTMSRVGGCGKVLGY
jgi:hypothetical protein